MSALTVSIAARQISTRRSRGIHPQSASRTVNEASTTYGVCDLDEAKGPKR